VEGTWHIEDVNTLADVSALARFQLVDEFVGELRRRIAEAGS
jgi:hypothetical protein